MTKEEELRVKDEEASVAVPSSKKIKSDRKIKCQYCPSTPGTYYNVSSKITEHLKSEVHEKHRDVMFKCPLCGLYLNLSLTGFERHVYKKEGPEFSKLYAAYNEKVKKETGGGISKTDYIKCIFYQRVPEWRAWLAQHQRSSGTADFHIHVKGGREVALSKVTKEERRLEKYPDGLNEFQIDTDVTPLEDCRKVCDKIIHHTVKHMASFLGAGV